MNSVIKGMVISVHYDYVKLFVEKTDDFKTGVSNALVWSYIVQNSWKNGSVEKELKVDISVLKRMFGVSSHFVDALFDTARLIGIIPSFSKEEGAFIVFSLNSNIEELNESKVELNVKKKRVAVQYTEAFLEMIDVYPKRKTPHPKKTSFAAWQGRINDGVTEQELISAAKNYCKEAEDDGNIGTNFVLMISTFFGPNERYVPYLDKESSDNKSEFLSDHTSSVQNNSETMKGIHISENKTAKAKRIRIFNEKMNING